MPLGEKAGRCDALLPGGRGERRVHVDPDDMLLLSLSLSSRLPPPRLPVERFSLVIPSIKLEPWLTARRAAESPAIASRWPLILWGFVGCTGAPCFIRVTPGRPLRFKLSGVSSL